VKEAVKLKSVNSLFGEDMNKSLELRP